ncbi:MFS transporter [Actinoplanes sp. NPDC051343]|uniref:MFS transporter n=1 Tax=Actinoplanes sp. NPDC051343 TaxID=3363906 RepID=UPI00378E7346
MAETNLLKESDFRRLFYGQIFSQLGAQGLRLVLTLIAIEALRASESAVSLLVACLALAFPIIGLPVGAVVDRLRHRRVMISSDLGRAAVLASIPLAAWLWKLTMTQMYLVALVVGVGTVFFDVSYQSYLPRLIGRDKLLEGNAKLETVRTVAQMGGPSVGGYLFQLLPAALSPVAVIGGFVGSAACIAAIRKPEPVREKRPIKEIGGDIVAGFRFVVTRRLMVLIVVCSAIFNFFISMHYPIYLILLSRDLRLPGAAIGILLAGSGVGGIWGSVAVRRLSARLGLVRLAAYSVAAIALCMFLLPIVQSDWRLSLVALYQLVSGFAVVAYNVSTVSFMQELTPEPMLGRMAATVRTLMWGTVPIGSLVGGLSADLIGVRLTLLVCAAGVALAGVWLFTASPRAVDPHELATGLQPAA